jgi:AcrR family transcriptional regulator
MKENDSPMRADARRNRQLVLAAADEPFAAEGIGVSTDEIARRAGVGSGTLYRHFPTKESLFEAVLVEPMARLAAQARDEAESDRPADALFALMVHLSCEAASRRNLISAMAGVGINVNETAVSLKADIENAVETLLERAKEAGQVRADATKADVMALTMATCTVAAQGKLDCSQSRMVEIVCDGLRPRPRARHRST